MRLNWQIQVTNSLLILFQPGEGGKDRGGTRYFLLQGEDPEVAHITSAHKLVSHTPLQGKPGNHWSWQPCAELELRSPDIEGQENS